MDNKPHMDCPVLRKRFAEIKYTALEKPTCASETFFDLDVDKLRYDIGLMCLWIKGKRHG